MERQGAGVSDGKSAGTGEQDWFLSVDGRQVMTGDEVSIGVVFNNVTGRNFELAKAEPWREMKHADYLDWMSRELGVALKPGASVGMGAAGQAQSEAGVIKLVEA